MTGGLSFDSGPANVVRLYSWGLLFVVPLALSLAGSDTAEQRETQLRLGDMEEGAAALTPRDNYYTSVSLATKVTWTALVAVVFALIVSTPFLL